MSANPTLVSLRDSKVSSTYKRLCQFSNAILKSKLRFSTIETREAIFLDFPEKKSLSQQNLLNADLPVFTTLQSLQLIENF